MYVNYLIPIQIEQNKQQKNVASYALCKLLKENIKFYSLLFK